MSIDLATVGIRLDTSGVAEGEKVVTSSFAKMTDGATKLVAAEQKRLEQESRLAATQRRWAAESAARASAEQQQLAALEALLALEERQAQAQRTRAQQEQQMTIILRAEAAAHAENTARINAATAAKQGAIAGTNKLSTSAQTLAFQLAGIPGTVGRVASSLGQLFIGGGVTLGVVAGVSAIIAIWDHFTHGQREAKQASDNLLASLEKARKERSGEDEAEKLAIVRKAVDDAQRRLTSLQNSPIRVDAKTGVSTSTIDARAIDRASAALEKVKGQLKELGAQANETVFGGLDDGLEKLNKDAEAFQKARLAEMERTRQIESANAIQRAKNTGDFATIEAAYHAAALEAIEAETWAMVGKNATQVEARRQALLATAELERQARLAAQLEKIFETIKPIPTVVDPRTGVRSTLTDFSNTGIDPNQGKNFKAADDAAKATRDAFVKNFEQIFTRGNDGFLSLFRNVEDMARKAAARSVAGFAFDKLNLEKLTKKDAEGNTSLTGTGTAIVAAGVATIGIVKSILDHAEKAREAVKRFDEARKDFGVSLDAYVANATGATNALSDALVASAATRKRQEDDARAVRDAGFDAAKAQGNFEHKKRGQIMRDAAAEYEAAMARIAEAAKADAERIRREAEDRKRALNEDLKVRVLRANGQSDEAEAMALQITQAREFAALVKELGDPITHALDAATQASIEYTQQVEREALAKRQAIDLARRAQDNLDLEGNTSARGFRIDARHAALAGNDKDAGAFGRQADAIDARTTAARAQFEARQLFEAGTITEVLFKQISAAIDDELNLSLAELQKQAEDTAKAIAETNRQANLDLGVRRLVLNGMTEAAEIERDRIAAEREYAQAVKDGLDATTLATLRQIQGDEAAAKAMQKLVDKTKALADAMYAQARATEDLTVRSLKANGFGGAGDVAAQLFAQQEERRKAIEEGRSADFLATLDRVQAEERAFADKARRDAQDEAFRNAVGTAPGSSALADSKTSVNLAVGISESTGGAVLGAFRSGLVYWSYLPRIEAGINRVYDRLGNLRGLTLDDVDTGLAFASAGADAVNGVPPGNR